VNGEPDALLTLERGDRRARLHDALAQFPDTLRTAVMLRDSQELTYQEIADKLALPEGTVKSRINRGRKELARQIRRTMPDGGATRSPPEPQGGIT
jgi:RNA polymerase sigma factor (sigma-70 family)